MLASEAGCDVSVVSTAFADTIGTPMNKKRRKPLWSKDFPCPFNTTQIRDGLMKQAAEKMTHAREGRKLLRLRVARMGLLPAATKAAHLRIPGGLWRQ
jgi:hypothetical protein